MKITIRKPRADEWQGYKDLRLESLRDFPQGFSSSYDEAILKPDEEWQYDLISSQEEKDSVMLCAYDGNEMIGCVGSYWKNKSKTRHVANVGLMYVKKSHQGKGVGNLLLNELLKLLTGMNRFRKIKLEVIQGNLPAYNLYRKAGFVDTGINHDELLINGSYVNTICMEKIPA